MSPNDTRRRRLAGVLLRRRDTSVPADGGAIVVAPSAQGKTASVTASVALDWDRPVVVASARADGLRQADPSTSGADGGVS